jgi:hypothetical protein
MDEGEDPGARLRPLGAKACRAAPDLEKSLLHGVLRMALVAQDAKGQPVGDPRDAVVELGERIFIPSRYERDECLVGQMGVVLAHGDAVLRLGQS